MLIYKDCMEETQELQYVCDPCDITEGGGVRSLCLLKKGTTIPNPYTQLDIDILVGAGLIYVMAETRGSFDGGTPKMVTGYGDNKERQIGNDYVLQVKDPIFSDNYAFWSAVEKVEDWNIAFRTETQLAVVYDDCTITTKAPSEEGIDTDVVWDIEAKWYSKNKPTIQPYIAGIFNNILKTLDVIYGGTIANGGVVKLNIDADKTGYIKLPNGAILTTVDGVIDTTYTGVGGAITYYVPKDNLLIDYSDSDLIDTNNLALKSAINITSSNIVVGGELKTNSTAIFGNLDAQTKAKIIVSTANGWTLNVLNYIPNLANIMHIGNSITLSVPLGGIWWGTWGMAASQADKDYVSVFNSKINTDYGITLASKVFSAVSWEVNHATFDKSLFDSNFDGTEDFIIVKVGENVAETPESLATFTADYVDLIEYIQGKSPNAKIILCTSFFTWGNDIKTAMINAAIALDLPYIVLDGLDTPANRSFIGAEVYGDDQILHTISDGAVAAHPSDVGMAAISNLIHQTAWTL